MANRTETLKIRVTKSEKDAILDYMEESREADTISDFGRLALLDHIHTDEEETATIDTDTIMDVMTVALSDVNEELDTLSHHVASMESKVRADDDTDKLARQIFHNLPEYSDPSEFPDAFSEVNVNLAGDDLDEAKKLSTPSAWARWFDRNEADVRAACGLMLEYYPDAQFVHETYEDENKSIQAPERRYYKIPQ